MPVVVARHAGLDGRFAFGFGGFARGLWWRRGFCPFVAVAAVARRGGAFAPFVAAVFGGGFGVGGGVAVFFEQGDDFGEQRGEAGFLHGRRDLRRGCARDDALHGGLFGDGFARFDGDVAFFVAFVAGAQAVARYRDGVFVPVVFALALDVVVRRVQVGVRHEDDFDFVALFDLADDGAFFVQKVGGDAHWQFAGDAAGALFHRFFFNQAQE